MVLKEKKIKLAKISSRSSPLLLRALTSGDCENVCRWMTSSYVLQHSFVIPGPKSRPADFSTTEYAKKYFDMLMTDKKRLSFAIEVNGLHIGNIGLKDIDFVQMTAECFIEIGERRHRARGLGIEAMKQLLNMAFFTYQLKEVALDVLEFNFPALKIYDRIGFTITGLSGWHYDEYGQYWRVLRMSLGQSNW